MSKKIKLDEETLVVIEEEALKCSKSAVNWGWIEAYKKLAFYANVIHAFESRSSENN